MDNDCDNDTQEVDEDEDGVDDLNIACKTSFPGICSAGKTGCQGPVKTCVADVKVGQQSETCDGLDEDCDGTKDNGNLCTNGNTCGGAAGCRCGGGPGCAGAQECCPGGCANLQSSPGSCGACGVSCGPGEACSGGKCTCGAAAGPVGGGKVCTSGTCVGGACTTCNPSVNLATQAVASSSGGGKAPCCAPSRMNDGATQSSCAMHWISAGSATSGKWIQLTWPAPVTFNHIHVDTSPPGGVCSFSSNRTLKSGTVQYRSGSSWLTLTSVSGKTGDWSIALPQVSSNMIRIYNARPISSNPIIFEWQVRCQ